MGNYPVITCDIIESHALEQREQAQKHIQAGLEEINTRFATVIAVPFQFTLGSEFQGVLTDLGQAPYIAGRLREEIAPVKLRIAIGFGEITTGLSEDMRKVDGPAFHIARDVMKNLKRKQGRRGLKHKQHLTGFASGQGSDSTVDIIYMLYDVLISERTEKQWWATKVYNLAGSATRAATMFGTTFQNISKQVNAAHLFETNQSEQFLGHYLVGRYANLIDDEAAYQILSYVANG